jgi:hypothetical protein
VTVNAINGVATFSTLSLNRVGTGYTLTAASSGLTGATSSPFNITPGTANRLVFTTQPSDTVAGVSINPTVTIQDAFGNTVTGSSASISMAFGTNPGGGGTLSGTNPVSASGGVATFSNLWINRAATGYTLVASSSGLTSATSNTFNITPAAVSASVSTVVASPTSTSGGTSTVTVTLFDAFGNPVSGRAVTLAGSVTGNGRSITPASGTSNASGQVAFTVTDSHKETVTYSATDTTDGISITQQASVNFT